MAIFVDKPTFVFERDMKFFSEDELEQIWRLSESALAALWDNENDKCWDEC